MKCRVCGAKLRSTTTDLPFKLSERTIVILKNLPVAQCDGCNEYLITDAVLATVDELFAKVDRSAELEIIPFAA